MEILNAKSKFRQTAKPYRHDKGILFHSDKEVLNKSRLFDILSACHSNDVSGGGGGGGGGGYFVAEKNLLQVCREILLER